MLDFPYSGVAAFAFGLVATLVLAAWLTPARWWRRLNAGAVAIVVLGTWGLGSLALWLMTPDAKQTLVAAAPALPPAAVPARGEVSFRVHEALNLRAARGTGAARIAVVPAGSLVTTTGARDGDWWQVRASVNGRTVEGWSSSLWLRRADERPM
ncbi:SH3 domain-containing protein [Massilia sp. PAMC28688]|uniref:SH3 domain-containing protein n=1 Tax=Massilia sp. PAMC28688 TaxID=2861283 RepID=UPI001C626400|nr:SH3 domain-containing protein [Massilia sp. PAMC28688]QYF93358.1 SH3 domain-containing protein [Massilia sp. PAMC28688]